ncbi:uncharacterized protein LOC119580457 [Penaeus monodon]|uniref:uncharacterized protein LOC119580457 n=1 Tax=Penaeus monodon TaxID=6687 RepID=UPI0018A7D5E4|nr:uncharacterized protein LOC119580457 [Penaeus monodon]
MAYILKRRALWASLSRRTDISRCFGSSSIQEQLAVPLEEELRSAKPTSEIPGPKAYPVFGSMFTMMKGHKFDAKAAHKLYTNMNNVYGPVYRLSIPITGNFTVVSSPDDCEKLLRLTMHNPQRMPMASIKSVREEAADGIFKNRTGILLENGEEWWRVRSKVQTPMMKPKLVGAYLQQMDRVSSEFTNRIAQLQAEHGEMPSDFQFELYKWALESVSLVALNRRMGCLNPDIAQDSDSLRLIEVVNDIFQSMNDMEMGSMLWRIMPTASYRKLKRRHGQFLEIATQNIRETEAAILAADPDSERELSLMENLLMTEGLTREDVITLILDMLVAGIDTTAHTLGFTLYLLARNPQVQAKLQEEIDTVLGDHEGPLLPKHMAQFSYLKAVIREALRIFPPAIGMVRILDQDAVLGGYVIPKGDKVIYPNVVAAWDEKYFPQAKEFVPDRWLRNRPLGPIHPYASLPFAAGARMCIGRRIAEQEMYTFLARVLQRFTVDYKYQDIDMKTRLIAMPSEPLRYDCVPESIHDLYSSASIYFQPSSIHTLLSAHTVGPRLLTSHANTTFRSLPFYFIYFFILGEQEHERIRFDNCDYVIHELPTTPKNQCVRSVPITRHLLSVCSVCVLCFPNTQALTMALLVKQRALWASLSLRGVISRSLGSSSIQRQETASLEDEIRAARPLSEMPGPKTYPVIGSLRDMLADFDSKAYHKYYLRACGTYGPTFRVIVPGIGPMVLTTNPDDCEKLLRVTMHNPLRTPMASLKAMRDRAIDDFFEKKGGILVENGDEWWRVRSRVQTPMMKPKVVGTYLQQMDQVSVEFMDRIAELQAEHGEMPSDFQFELYKWALESVGLVALNRRLGCLNPSIHEDSDALRLIEIVNDIFQALNDTESSLGLWKLFPIPPFKKLKKRHEQFLEIAVRSIQQTEAAILAQDPDSEHEVSLMESLLTTEGLTKKDVVTLILDMLFAGIDTTSHTLGFTLYLLARNPDAQAKLQAEVDSVLGGHEGPLLPKHMAQFSYMKGVIKETLRIYPLTLGVGRILDKECVLSGYAIPKGATAVSLNMISSWDEKYFPRAKEFVPDRWLRNRPLGPIHPYASLPFGAGTRMCIGRRIAEQEMYTFLARTMQRFTVDYKYKDMDILTRLVFMPSEPLKFSFSERRK